MSCSFFLQIPGNCSFTCPICSVTVTTSGEFTSHLRSHNIVEPKDKQFTCTVCGRTLCSISSLDRHMLVHSGERPFQCSVCGMSFTTNGNMHRHMRTHGSHSTRRQRGVPIIRKGRKYEDDEDFKTSKRIHPDSDAEEIQEEPAACTKTFLSAYGLQSHMEMHTETSYSCDTCQLSFLTPQALEDHTFVAHSKKKQQSSPNGKSGNAALSEFQQSNGFFELASLCDVSIAKFPLIAKAWCEESVIRPSSQFHKFTCKHCRKSFPCKSALMLHKSRHSKEDASFCSVCDTHFMSKVELETHKLTHIPPERGDREDKGSETKMDFMALLNLTKKCETNTPQPQVKLNSVSTDFDFNNVAYFSQKKMSFKQHFKSVVKKRKKTVTVDEDSGDLADIESILKMTAGITSSVSVKQQDPCVSSSTSTLPVKSEPAKPGCPDENGNSAMADSLTTEDGNGMLQCSQCSAPFSNLRSLKSHMRSHLGLSPYQCKICNYQTIDKSTLLRHLRSHNGERPFLCQLCGYAFTTKANCERHVKNKHGKDSRSDILLCIKSSPTLTESSTTLESLHSPDTMCRYCNTDFKFLRALQKHLRTHHAKHRNVFRPFKCRLCTLGFSTRNNCIRHIINHHQDLDRGLVKNAVVIQTANIETVAAHATNKQAHSEDASPKSADETDVVADIHDDFSDDDSCLVIDISKKADKQADKSMTNSNTASKVKETPEMSKPCEVPLDLSMKNSSNRGHSEDQRNETQAQREASINRSLLELTRNPLWLANNIAPPSVKEEASNVKVEPGLDELVSDSMIFLGKCYDNALQKWVCPHCADMFNSPAKLKIHMSTHKVTKRPFRCYLCPTTFVSRASLGTHLQNYHHVKKSVLDDSQFEKAIQTACLPPNLIPPSMGIFPNFNTLAKLQPLLGLNLLSSSKPDADKANALQIHAPSEFSKTQLSPKSSTAYSNPDQLQLNKGTVLKQLEIDVDLPNKQCKNSGEDNLDEDIESNQDSGSDKGSFDSQDSDLADVSKMMHVTDAGRFKGLLQLQDGPIISPPERNDVAQKPDSTKPSPTGEERRKGRSSYSMTPHKYNCPHCSRRFPWESSLQRHILTHTGQKPYKCPKCPVSFSTKSNRVRHLARKHGSVSSPSVIPKQRNSPFLCKVCKNGYSSMGNLRRHCQLKHADHDLATLLAHVGYPQSDTNGFSIIDTAKILVNMDTSLGSLSQLGNISDHETDDEDDDKDNDDDSDTAYYCRHCDEVFPTMEKLVVHSDTHKTGAEHAYRCHMCESVSFQEKDSCLQHFKTNHPDEYAEMIGSTDGEADDACPSTDYAERKIFCVFCPKRFWSTQDWRRHMRTHSGERPFQCDICYRRFSLKHSMTRHRKLHLEDSTDVSTIVTTEGMAIKDKSDSVLDSSDMIQNLLGIENAAMIDTMLEDPNKAAELLGVKT